MHLKKLMHESNLKTHNCRNVYIQQGGEENQTKFKYFRSRKYLFHFYNMKVKNIPSGFGCCKRLGGSTLGNSKFRSFRLINLHAMLNSSIFIFPSASVSASDLKHKMKVFMWSNSKKNVIINSLRVHKHIHIHNNVY